jgi:hypothetical protein
MDYGHSVIKSLSINCDSTSSGILSCTTTCACLEVSFNTHPNDVCESTGEM